MKTKERKAKTIKLRGFIVPNDITIRLMKSAQSLSVRTWKEKEEENKLSFTGRYKGIDLELSRYLSRSREMVSNPSPYFGGNADELQTSYGYRYSLRSKKLDCEIDGSPLSQSPKVEELFKLVEKHKHSSN